MSSPHSPVHTNNDQLVGVNERLVQADGYDPDQHSEVSVIILHMSELLSSFVREDTPEKRAEWAHALAEVRNAVDTVHAHEELRFITDFSIMLEEGLQCIADKCAKLEAMVKNGLAARTPIKYVHSAAAAARTPIKYGHAAAVAAPTARTPVRWQQQHNIAMVPVAARTPKKWQQQYNIVTPVAARTPKKWQQHKIAMTPPVVARFKKQPPKAQFVACDLCPDVVPRLRYANHLKHTHPEEFDKVAKFRCSYCQTARFIKEGALKAHLEVCKIRLEQLSIERRLPLAQLFCRLCNVHCATLLELAEHTEKKHPHCQLLACTGCAQMFRWPEPLFAHWKEAKKYPLSRCVSAPATLLSRSKLLAQMLARAKAIGSEKNFAYIECFNQDIACQKCGHVFGGFKQLYGHVHTKHTRDVQSSLLFGCIGCNARYKCPPSLRDHLLTSELEEYEPCRNGGVAYWDDMLISKDMRPEERRAEEGAKEEEGTVPGDFGTSEDQEKEGDKEEEGVDVMGDYRNPEDLAKDEDKKEEEEAVDYGTSEDLANDSDKKEEDTVIGFGSSEDHANDEEKNEDTVAEEEKADEDTVMGGYRGLDEEKEGVEEDTVFEEDDTPHALDEEKVEEVKWESEMKTDLKIKIKRTSIPDQSMEVDAGFNSMDDMPTLDLCD